jgi:archaellum component FlaC
MNPETEEIKRHFDVVAGEFRSEIGEFRSEIKDLRSEFKNLASQFKNLGSEFTGLGSEFTGLRSEFTGLRSNFKDVRSEFQDLHRHFDVVAESLRGQIRLVAEGVVGLDEKFTLEFRNVRSEMREQIDDAKALLRASYEDLRRERKPS